MSTDDQNQTVLTRISLASFLWDIDISADLDQMLQSVASDHGV